MSHDENPDPFVIDRDLQRSMLEQMRDAYPDMIRGFPERRGLSRVEMSNLWYLREHGLCEADIVLGRRGYWSWSGAKITAAGLDFLEQDGGLTAILGVVTVKLHADTVRDLILKKVDDSDLPSEKKSVWKRAIDALPGITLQAASKDLITAGIDHVPGGLTWIEHLIGMAS